MEGKTVLITGASSGIGIELAVYFASCKCRLALTGTNETNLQSTRSKCLEAGAADKDIALIIADLAKEDDIRRIVDETISKLDKLHVLINNAGVYRGSGVVGTRMEDFDMNFLINTRASFYLTQLAVPHLEATRGNIVNISSVAAFRPVVDTISFSMSKAALDQFTKMAAVELAAKNIRVNSVNPGGVEMSDDEQRRAFWKPKTPLRRLATKDEVVKSVAFLADDSWSSFTTGNILVVDGGLCLQSP